MATLHIRNVPDSLYVRLQQQARAENRSLSAEVITLLTKALDEESDDQAAILARIRRRRSYAPVAMGAPDSMTLLREDRDR